MQVEPDDFLLYDHLYKHLFLRSLQYVIYSLSSLDIGNFMCTWSLSNLIYIFSFERDHF